jgi:hypothetical protein
MRISALTAGLAALALAAPAQAHGSLAATTQAATAITATSAILHGTLTDVGDNGWSQFSYWHAGIPAALTSVTTAPKGKGPLAASATVTGLAPATTYSFKVTAGDKDHVRNGDVLTFTTAAASTTGADPTLAPAAPTTAPGPSDGAQPPEPVLGRSVVLAAERGTVRMRLPGAQRLAPLTSAGAVPLGTLVDVRAGTVRLEAATPNGAGQSASLRGALFEVRQPTGGQGMTELILRGGDFGACRHGRLGRAARATRRRPPSRSLWAHDNGGRFRTRGRNSVATVRGTTWTTTDTCAGTRTRVAAGSVVVHDLRRNARVTVRAGQAYLARSAR